MLDQLGGPNREAGFLTGVSQGSFEPVDLPGTDDARVAELVERYGDMRLGTTTDASNIAIAERLGITEIATRRPTALHRRPPSSHRDVHAAARAGLKALCTSICRDPAGERYSCRSKHPNQSCGTFEDRVAACLHAGGTRGRQAPEGQELLGGAGRAEDRQALFVGHQLDFGGVQGLNVASRAVRHPQGLSCAAGVSVAASADTWARSSSGEAVRSTRWTAMAELVPLTS